MGNIDISILKEIPNLSERYELIIEPLAPLSMVEEFPGSFYKTLKIPSKKMICGLFENILGWHINWQDRSLIIKDLKSIRKKQKINFNEMQSGSTYMPLLMEYFNVECKRIDKFEEVIFYKDLWNRLHSRTDSDKHARGTENIDYNIIPLKRQLKRDSKDYRIIDKENFKQFFKKYVLQYPLFYSTPTYREYLYINGVYHFILNIDKCLASLLTEKLQKVNIGYLGNSEGWINIKLEKYD